MRHLTTGSGLPPIGLRLNQNWNHPASIWNPVSIQPIVTTLASIGHEQRRRRSPFAEAINGNIKSLLRRGRGYRDPNYLLLKAQRLAATKT